MNHRMTGLAAFAAALLMLGAHSDAAFTYTSSQSPTSITSGGSALTLSGTSSSGILSGTTNINSVNVALASSTNPPPTNSFSLTFVDTVTINTVGDGSVVFAINETLNFPRSDAQGSQSTLTVNSVLPLVGQDAQFRYTISAALYAQPTVNGSPGNISYTITETAVPEPASLGMMALGLGSAGFVAIRRRRRAA